MAVKKKYRFQKDLILRKERKKKSQKKVKNFGKIHCRVDFEKETISFPRLAVHKRDD
jgi:hypothetical protein